MCFMSVEVWSGGGHVCVGVCVCVCMCVRRVSYGEGCGSMYGWIGLFVFTTDIIFASSIVQSMY